MGKKVYCYFNKRMSRIIIYKICCILPEMCSDVFVGSTTNLARKMQSHKTNVLNPQLQAGFQIVIEQKANTFTNCEIQDDYNYWRKCTINTVNYTEETLVVYVSDIEKNQVIWQASKTCDLNRSKKTLKPYIEELVESLFNEYPKLNY